jgi:hypothetical protein
MTNPTTSLQGASANTVVTNGILEILSLEVKRVRILAKGIEFINLHPKEGADLGDLRCLSLDCGRSHVGHSSGDL